jgi:hypothetical protein
VRISPSGSDKTLIQGREILNRLDQKSNEIQSSQQQIKNVVKESIDQTKIHAESIKAEIRSTTTDIHTNTSTLLKVCAGLRTDVKRFEKKILVSQDETALQNKLALRDLKNNSVMTLRSITQARLIGWQLLQHFTRFSAEVLYYLKSLHNSNIEIYELLRRIQSSIARPLTEVHSDNITFIDALNRRHDLPYAYFQDQEVFESMLRCKFRDLPGSDKVKRGEYTIKNSKLSGRMIRRPDWNRSVFPGMTLQMLLILKLFRSSDSTCPRVQCKGSSQLDPIADIMIW